MAPPSEKRATLPPKSLIDLPADVIDDILSRLPIGDAVRTSILSRPWRRRWRSITDIHVITEDGASVDHVLRHHSGPIRSFSLTFNFPFYNDSSQNHLSLWLSILASDPDPLRPLTLRFRDCWLVLHSSLFSFRNLTSLELKSCVLPSSRCLFLGFPSLQNLNLNRIYFPNKFGNLDDFISCCPLLQRLIMLGVKGGEHLNICAPNLRSLVFAGQFVEFAMVSTPLLTAASIGLEGVVVESDDGDYEALYEHSLRKCNLFEVFGRVRSIEKLELVSSSLHYLGEFTTLEMVPDSFQMLKILILTVDFGCVDETLSAIGLLRSSPNLEELEIKGRKCSRNNVKLGLKFWQKQNYLELPKLQSLKLTYVIMPGVLELEFVDFILPKAQHLKKMVIDVSFAYQESKSKELTEYWRASTRAEITFTGAS